MNVKLARNRPGRWIIYAAFKFTFGVFHVLGECHCYPTGFNLVFVLTIMEGPLHIIIGEIVWVLFCYSLIVADSRRKSDINCTFVFFPADISARSYSGKLVKRNVGCNKVG